MRATDPTELPSTSVVSAPNNQTEDLSTHPVTNACPIVLPGSLRPFPRVDAVHTVERRKRPCGKTRILTATPEKNEIEQAANKRKNRPPVRLPYNKKKRANAENISPEEEDDDVEFNINPLDRSASRAIAPITTRSGRQTRAKQRLDI